jgi:hypothetical protein
MLTYGCIIVKHTTIAGIVTHFSKGIDARYYYILYCNVLDAILFTYHYYIRTSLMLDGQFIVIEGIHDLLVAILGCSINVIAGIYN